MLFFLVAPCLTLVCMVGMVKDGAGLCASRQTTAVQFLKAATHVCVAPATCGVLPLPAGHAAFLVVSRKLCMWGILPFGMFQVGTLEPGGG